MAGPRVLISGCSGGGKSALAAELTRRGHAVVTEPGRRIVAEEVAGDGCALPWRDMAAFARRALAMAAADIQGAASLPGPVFFDRGLVDAAVALEHSGGPSAAVTLATTPRYHHLVFLTPPWPEIHVTDAARRHGATEAVAEYERLCAAFPALGYRTEILPKASVAKRADLVLSRLAAT